jgi:hypothetical protein
MSVAAAMVALGLCLPATGQSAPSSAPTTAPATQAVPTIAAQVELIDGAVKERTIHGWNSSRLVMYRGALYAAITVQDDDANNRWKDAGLILRRQADGKWVEAGRLPNNPDHLMVDPRGRFWVISPSTYNTCEVFRSAPNADLSKWELVYNGTCAYNGGSVSPEGNVLILHAETSKGRPNAVIAAFYDAASDTWHKSRFETPEGRDGYETIILKGKKALVVVGSSAFPPPEQAKDPNDVMISFGGIKWPKAATPWRYVRLAACDDLTQGQWKTRPFIDDAWGATGLEDAYATSDGKLYLLYWHGGGPTKADSEASKGGVYLAKISDDLSADVRKVDMPYRKPKLLVDSASGRWFLAASQNNERYLWDLDISDGQFKLDNPRRLEGTQGKLFGLVTHTLRPQRFGGEEDANRFYLMSTGAVDKTKDKEKNNALLNIISFEIPKK